MMGNCDMCFLKSEAQIAMMMRQFPEKANGGLIWKNKQENNLIETEA